MLWRCEESIEDNPSFLLLAYQLLFQPDFQDGNEVSKIPILYQELLYFGQIAGKFIP